MSLRSWQIALLLGAIGCSGPRPLPAILTDAEAEVPDDASVGMGSGEQPVDAATPTTGEGSTEDGGAQAGSDAGEHPPAAIPGVPSLLEPVDEQTFYLHEKAKLRGSCGSDASTRARFELQPADGGLPRFVDGTDVEAGGSAREQMVAYAFPKPGDYAVRLTCLATGGRRTLGSEVQVHVRPTPQLVFTNRAQLPFYSNSLFATALDSLGEERQISPEGKPYASYYDLRYAESGAFVTVQTTGFVDNNARGVVRPCRDAQCAEQPLDFAFQRAGACAPGNLTFAEDGKTAWATYDCGEPTGLHWIDLETPTPTPHLIASGGSTASYLLGGKALLYKVGADLRLLDLQQPELQAKIVASGVDSYLVSPDARHLAVAGHGQLEFFVVQAAPLGMTKSGAQELAYPLTYSSPLKASDALLLVQQNRGYKDGQAQYDMLAMPWDGSAQIQLCGPASDCNAAVCGSRVISTAKQSTSLWDFTSWPASEPSAVELLSGSYTNVSGLTFDPSCSRVSHYSWNSGNKFVADLDKLTVTMPKDRVTLLADDKLLVHRAEGFSVHQLASDGSVEKTALLELVDASQRASSLSFSPDLKHVVFLADMDRAGTLDAFSFRSDDLTVRPLARKLPGGAVIAFSPDSRYVTLGGAPGWDAQTGEPANNRLREYELSTSKLLWTSEGATKPRSSINSVVRLGDSQRVFFDGIASSSRESRLYEVDLTSDQRFDDLADAVTRTALSNWRISPDGSALAFARGSAIWFSSLLPEERADPALAWTVPERPWLSSAGPGTWLDLSNEGLLFEPTYRGELRWFNGAGGDSVRLRPALGVNGFRSLATAPAPYSAVVERYTAGDSPQLFLLDLSNAATPRTTSLGVVLAHHLSKERRFLLFQTSAGHQVLDLITGSVRTLGSTIPGVPVPAELLSSSSPLRESKSRVAFRQEDYVFVVDLQKGQLTHRIELRGATVSGLSEDLSFAITCQYEDRGRAAFERVDLSTGAVIPLLSLPREARDCYDTYVSPKGDWLVYQTLTSSESFLLKTDGSRPPVALGIDAYNVSMDRADHYLIAADRFYGPLLIWSTQEPEAGSQRVHSSALSSVESVTWID